MVLKDLNFLKGYWDGYTNGKGHSQHMKSTLVILFCMISSFTAAQVVSGFKAQTFSNEKSDTLVYRLLAPLAQQGDKKYPLVLVLHGAGERGQDNTKQLTHGASLFLKEEIRRSFPAYVLFPQCAEEDYWASVAINRSSLPLQLDFDYNRSLTKSLQLVIDLVHTLIRTEKVDVSRIYIVGLSMGGMGTYEAVYHYPHLFAAAIPMCGAGDTERYAIKKPTLPFWIFHGSADTVIEVKHSRQMVDTIKGFSSLIKYTEYPGVGHNSWDYAFAEPELLAWLFSQKRH